MIKYLSFSSGEQPKSILHTGQEFTSSSVNFSYMHPLQTVFKFINNNNYILFDNGYFICIHATCNAHDTERKYCLWCSLYASIKFFSRKQKLIRWKIRKLFLLHARTRNLIFWEVSIKFLSYTAANNLAIGSVLLWSTSIHKTKLFKNTKFFQK